jgi:proteic killer suppression protein
MIRTFKNHESEDVFNGDKKSKKARSLLPLELWRVAGRKLDQLNRVTELRQMNVPPGNRLEQLDHDRMGQHSVRINDQYRICFVWADDGAHDVEITDYH